MHAPGRRIILITVPKFTIARSGATARRMLALSLHKSMQAREKRENQSLDTLFRVHLSAERSECMTEQNSCPERDGSTQHTRVARCLGTRNDNARHAMP